jgi:hypothetical protein
VSGGKQGIHDIYMMNAWLSINCCNMYVPDQRHI